MTEDSDERKVENKTQKKIKNKDLLMEAVVLAVTWPLLLMVVV